MNNFIIKSEGLGYELGFKYFKYIFKYAFPDKNIIYDFNNEYNNPDLVIRSPHFYREAEFNYNCPYISISGEPFRVSLKNNKLPLCEFNTYLPIIKENSNELIIDPGIYSNKCKSIWNEQLFFITKNIKSFYIPFILYTENIDYNNIRKFNNLEDKFLDFIYIGTNATQKIRNKFFNDLYNLYKLEDSNNLYKIKSLGPNLNTDNYIISKETDITTIYRHFKFIFAFENNYIEGYITEKILLPFMAGSIPIYWGHKDIKKYFNDKAFFYVNDYLEKGWFFDDIIRELKRLANDNDENTGWKKYLKEPIFINNEIPDIFNLFNNKYITNYAREISNYIKLNYKNI